MNFSFKEIDGKIQMRDLRSSEEQAQGVELTKDEIITRLSTKVVGLERIMDQVMQDSERQMLGMSDRIAMMAPYYDMYKLLQDSVLANPMLMIEWQRFCTMLKLTDPDEDKYNQALGK